jgi:hypothetical protein
MHLKQKPESNPFTPIRTSIRTNIDDNHIINKSKINKSKFINMSNININNNGNINKQSNKSFDLEKNLKNNDIISSKTDKIKDNINNIDINTEEINLIDETEQL